MTLNSLSKFIWCNIIIWVYQNVILFIANLPLIDNESMNLLPGCSWNKFRTILKKKNYGNVDIFWCLTFFVVHCLFSWLNFYHSSKRGDYRTREGLRFTLVTEGGSKCQSNGIRKPVFFQLFLTTPTFAKTIFDTKIFFFFLIFFSRWRNLACEIGYFESWGPLQCFVFRSQSEDLFVKNKLRMVYSLYSSPVAEAAV